MLELKQIKKDYFVGDGVVHALQGITLSFRESEFVAMLGPSGCGKTTMLNIIGGLDQYTDGDLVINGVSTKHFKDRDWDNYRNHSVGFVFQSYHLIPHQSVLQNVELALTLSGVSKIERRERAKKALEEVGLGNQLKKRPSELSGGQMQRVAIARALVNNPDIILADEPTGALDTETSVQVMNLLKEISKDRLVVMVTHNPELAQKYATRIIRVLDGKIISDSAPLTEEEQCKGRKEEQIKQERTKNEKKPSMSFSTSFGLSLKNLFTKKGRTILTSFAGSIGIIGIALIFAVSQGLSSYITKTQEDTLSSYPLTIEATHVDIGTLLQSFMGAAKSEKDHEKDAIYTKGVIYDLIHALNTIEETENDLQSFKKYIEEEQAKEESVLQEAMNGVQYAYNLDLLIYTKNVDGEIILSNTTTLLRELMIENLGMDVSSMMNPNEMMNSFGMNSSSMSGGRALWQEMLAGENGTLINPLLKKQYDVIYGSWPSAYNEVVLVVDENNELDDMTLYALGLKSKEDMNAIMDAAMNKTELVANEQVWTYEEICNMEFRTILNADCYTLDEKSGLYTDLRDTDAGMRYLYDNGMVLKVSGIIRPKEDAVSTMLTGTIGYTNELTKYVIEQAKQSKAIQAQLENPGVDIFTGLPFEENTGNLTEEEKEIAFREYIASLDMTEKAEVYLQIRSIPSEEEMAAMVEQALRMTTEERMKQMLVQVFMQQMGMSEADVQEYVEKMEAEAIVEVYTQMITEQLKLQFAQSIQQQATGLSIQDMATSLDVIMSYFTPKEWAVYYDEILEFSKSSYEGNLNKLGYLDLEKPAAIHLYASSFENKDVIEDVIVTYNETVDEFSKISYTDYVGLMMSSITSIINAITYVLVAFVAISLVVSSIMIGVITLISVQERTKEIGILRAIGASKKDVSSLFNAETVIIGFASGVLGILVTYVLCIPINAIIQHVTGLSGLYAYLPTNVAGILVVISVILTLFAGIIPSQSAAKKDPVVALRTE